MTRPIQDVDRLLATLSPAVRPGTWVYCSVPFERDVSALQPVVTVREAEGLTMVLSEAQAAKAGLPVLFRAAWITLTVHSDLEAVGLTASVAAALTVAGISCNVVAGAYHDHLFVPEALVDRAMATLLDLQQASAAG